MKHVLLLFLLFLTPLPAGVLDPPPLLLEIEAKRLLARNQTPVDGDSQWVRQRLGLPGPAPAYPELFGAAGNGIADDTVEIRAAIAAAGTNGKIHLLPGATYLISGALDLLPGQVLDGNSATIKRAAQITTTTATPANNVTTAYVVASTAGFAVGQSVAFADALVAQADLVSDTTLASNNPKITAIVGNTITVSPAPICTIAGTSNIYSSYTTIGLAAGVRAHDLNINGNRAAWPWARWECVAEFYGDSADRAIVERCYAYHCPGEGMTVNGDYITLKDSIFEGLNGNGVHLSGCTHPVISGNRIINPTADADVGHSDGCISWSNDITDAIIDKNLLSGGRGGLTAINEGNNTDNTITNNTVRDSVTYGIEMTANASNTLIAGNRLYNCGGATDGGLKLGIGTGSGIQIQGNLFSDAAISLASASDLAFLDNQLLASPLTLAGITNSRVADNTLVASTVRWSACTGLLIGHNLVDYSSSSVIHPLATAGSANVGVNLIDNTVIGGARGIDITSGSSNCIISGNTMRGQADAGIFISGDGGYPGCEIRDNAVQTTLTSSGGWYGIRSAANGVTIRDNQVSNVHSTSQAAYAIQIADKCVVTGNRIRGDFNNGTIYVTGAVTGATVAYNIIDAVAITDSGTGTVTAGNIVIP